MGKYARCFAGDSYAVLLLLIHSAVYRVHQSRIAVGSDFFVSDFFTDGGFGKSGSFDEYFRSKSGDCLCGCGIADCHYRRNDSGKIPS